MDGKNSVTHTAMMLRALARPTVGGYGPVRLHLPSARSFGYFSIMRKVTKKKFLYLCGFKIKYL